MSEQKLKPCPFCGSEAGMETGIVQGMLRGMIGCTGCPVLMSPHRDKEQLVKAWNARAGEQELEEFVRESRKTGRLLNLAIVISIASLGLSIFTLIWS